MKLSIPSLRSASRRLGLVACFVVASQGGAATAAPADVATFFANAEIADAKVSPSGRHLAMAITSKSGRLVLAVANTDTLKPITVVAGSEAADIASFKWVNDDWLVYNVVDSQRPARDQDFGPGLFSVSRDGSEGRVLIRPHWNFGDSGTRIVASQLNPDHELLEVPEDSGDEVIVGQYRFDELGSVVSITPKRLNVVTGRSSVAAVGYPSGTTGWVFDRNGEPRVAVATASGMTEVFWRDKAAGSWKSLSRSPSNANAWVPNAVDASDRLYVLAPGSDSASVLKRFDFAAGVPESAAIVSAPGFDFSGELRFADAGKRLVGVRLDTDAATTVWLDPDYKKVQDAADKRFPGRINQLDCRICTGDRAVLVYSYSDRDPGAFYLYTPSTGAWTDVGSVRPQVDPRQMATLDLHRVKARDGLDLPVWVTTPRGATTAPRAAVVLVHGGPFQRGVHWTWSNDAQFLASRGYVVIEPEFRGSTGYGYRHFRAGWKNWGTTMQDDVADAVRWAVDQGKIDAKRVCIAGASYGGYAVLMGAIRFPDMYRCGVAWVAVSDPRLLFQETWQNDQSTESQRFSLPTLIGDPVKDADLLKAAAPVERAAEIRIPLLMAFGSNDRRVPLEHGSRMRAALKAAGNEPEYVVYDNEGHGFQKPGNRIDFYTRMENFLAKHLGGVDRK